MLAVVILFYNNLREKRLVPPTKQSGTTSFKNSFGTPVENSADSWCQVATENIGEHFIKYLIT